MSPLKGNRNRSLSQKFNPPIDKTHGQKNDKQRNTIGTNIVMSADSEIKNPKPKTTGNQPENQTYDGTEEVNNRLIGRWTRIVGVFTAALFCATIAIAVISFLQWSELHNADETARQAQRAFVAVRGITVTDLGPMQLPAKGGTASGPQGIAYRIAAVWENSGATETRGLEIGNSLVITWGGIRADVPKWVRPDVPKWPHQQIDGIKRVLLPKASIEEGGMTTVGANLNAVRDHQAFIFIFGFAKYQDAFGAKHFTLACFQLNAAPIDYTVEGAKGIGIYGTQCEEYNCADADCKRYKNTTGLTSLLSYLE